MGWFNHQPELHLRFSYLLVDFCKFIFILDAHGPFAPWINRCWPTANGIRVHNNHRDIPNTHYIRCIQGLIIKGTILVPPFSLQDWNSQTFSRPTVQHIKIQRLMIPVEILKNKKHKADRLTGWQADRLTGWQADTTTDWPKALNHPEPRCQHKVCLHLGCHWRQSYVLRQNLPDMGANYVEQFRHHMKCPWPCGWNFQRML